MPSSADERVWPRREVQMFAEDMERKLEANDDKKGGWDDCEVGWLLRRLGHEVGELRRALKKRKPWRTVAGEAADVANFAMMISQNYQTQQEAEAEDAR